MFKRVRVAIIGTATWAVVAAMLVAPPLQQAASAADAAQPCLLPLAPVTIFNTATTGTLGNGATRTATLPASLPAAVSAVTLQVRASGTKAGELTVAPASAPTQRLNVMNVVAGKWQSATSWITNPGNQLTVSFASVKGASLSATIEAVGYVATQSCFNALPPVAAVDTASGAGLAQAGALAAGSTTAVSLGGSSFLPGNAGIAPVHMRLSAGATPVTVTITNDAVPPITVGTWKLPANRTWVGTYEFPPSVTNGYSVAVTGGPANLSLTPLGWFVDANAHARASAAVIDTTTGLGAPKAALSSGQTVTFATPADVQQPAAVVLQLSGTPKTDTTASVWPTGTPQPANPTINATKGIAFLQQIVLSPATTGSTFSVRIGSGSTNLAVSVVGWVPYPPPVNQPVAGVTHITAATDVAAPVVDPTTGAETLTYTGTEKLDVGDVLVGDSTVDHPDGYLGVVSNIAAAPAGTSPLLLRSAKGRKSVKLIAATATSTATTSTDTVITLQPGTLQDALPNADMDSATLVVDSGDPPPDSSDPLPADTPPTPDPTASAATASTSTSDATRNIGGLPSAQQSSTSTGPAAASSPTGGSLPSSASLACSLGTSVKVSTSLKLNAGLNLTGSWRLGQGASAAFGAHAGLVGSVALNANSGTTCNAAATLAGPPLPTITFTVGPVPVVVRPVLTMGVKASGTVGAAFKASAAMNIGLDTGVAYANGAFTPYFTRYATFPVNVDARWGASMRVEVAPRLDLKIYGVAGPYFKLSAWAQGDVNLLNNPWWTAQAGVDGDVGLSLNVWLIHANFSAGVRNLAKWQAGSAPSTYPGPRISTTSLPSGSIGARYSSQLAGSGSPPLSWYRVNGSLPAGLTMSTSGAITGTPTTTQTTSFTVRAIDAAGYRSPSDATLSITVAPGPSITSTSLPDGRVGTGYNVGLQATGGAAPYTWSLRGGSLPAGLGLSSNGTISGTPAAAGFYSFTVRVVDANGAASPSDATLTINVASSAPPPPPSGARISLTRGGSAPAGYWYSVYLTGFSAGSAVSLTCRDSVDPGGFWTQNFTIAADGSAGDTTLCYSADGPDHWVTSSTGVESNHVTW